VEIPESVALKVGALPQLHFLLVHPQSILIKSSSEEQDETFKLGQIPQQDELIIGISEVVRPVAGAHV
jgi:hypothetical protein